MRANAARHLQCFVAVVLGGAVGCDAGEQPPTAPHGPHGGHTAQMPEGADFDVELTLDPPRQRMVLYIQEPGGAGPRPVRIDSLTGQFEAEGQSIDVTFDADPRDDDPEGYSSRFVLPLDQLPQQLVLSDQFVLKLKYASDGKAVTASISHSNNHGHKYRHD